MDRNELEKMERLLPAQVAVVKKILANKHDIVLPSYCDEFLARCIRMKDGRTEKAVKVILTYRQALITAGEWGLCFKPSLYVHFYEKNPVNLLKNREEDGQSPIFVMRGDAWDPKEISYEEAGAACWLLGEHFISEFKEFQTVGFTAICDCTGASWQQVWAINRWRMMTVLKWSQNGFSQRTHAIHVINHPRAITYLYKGVRPFLPEKSRSRTIFHDNLESLHRYVSPKILPFSLGGMLSPEDAFDKTLYSGLLAKDKYFEQLVSDGIPSK